MVWSTCPATTPASAPPQSACSASRDLLASYQAADERLNECGTPYIETTAEREVRGYCELSVRHLGPHGHIKSGLARRISAELHALADRVAKVSETFGWLAPRLDRFLARRAALTQADRQQAQELIAQLLDIVDTAIRSTRALTDDVLDLDPDLRIGSYVWTEDFADTADMIRDRLDQVAANEPAPDPNQLDLF